MTKIRSSSLMVMTFAAATMVGLSIPDFTEEDAKMFRQKDNQVIPGNQGTPGAERSSKRRQRRLHGRLETQNEISIRPGIRNGFIH